jgi:hypothetical protein
MNPLPHHIFTIEDMEVVKHRLENYWGYRSADLGCHQGLAGASDDRDADLMFVVAQVRSQMTYPPRSIWYMLLKGYLYVDSIGDRKIRE